VVNPGFHRGELGGELFRGAIDRRAGPNRARLGRTKDSSRTQKLDQRAGPNRARLGRAKDSSLPQKPDHRASGPKQGVSCGGLV
jgi:hypothetical protein